MKQTTVLLKGKKYTVWDDQSLVIRIVEDKVYINGVVCFPDSEVSTKPQPPSTVEYRPVPKQSDIRVFWLGCSLIVFSLLVVVGRVIIQLNSL